MRCMQDLNCQNGDFAFVGFRAALLAFTKFRS